MDRVSIFKNVNKNHADLLKPLLKPYACVAGTSVIQQGAPAEYIYLVLEGKAEVSFKPYDGIPITVSHITKDGLFGWSALVGSKTYTSSVRAIEDLETIRIRGSDLRKLCVNHPDAGKDILESLATAAASRWTNAHEQVKAILALGMKNERATKYW